MQRNRPALTHSAGSTVTLTKASLYLLTQQEGQVYAAHTQTQTHIRQKAAKLSVITHHYVDINPRKMGRSIILLDRSLLYVSSESFTVIGFQTEFSSRLCCCSVLQLSVTFFSTA